MTQTATAATKSDAPLSRLLLDCTKDKYRLVTAATRWAHEVRRRDQSTLPTQELINQALREILTGQVTLEAIEKLPPPPKEERKEPEFTLSPQLKESIEKAERNSKAPPEEPVDEEEDEE
jgi:DNA-directed RNA polymerase subunit K/omega